MERKELTEDPSEGAGSRLEPSSLTPFIYIHTYTHTHTHIYIYKILGGFHRGSAGKESACNTRDLGSIPGLGRSPGEGRGYPLQYSGLENSKDCRVRGVRKTWTRLSDFHFYLFLSALGLRC